MNVLFMSLVDKLSKNNIEISRYLSVTMNKLIFLLFLTKASSSPIKLQESPPTTTNLEDLPVLQGPEVYPEKRPHHLFIGKCRPYDQLLHSETIIINNDGTSKTAGDIRINVEGSVFITCVTVLDNMNENMTSGAYPSYVAGGVGHNYVTLGFKTAYGYGANFYIEIHGTDIKDSEKGNVNSEPTSSFKSGKTVWYKTLSI